MALIKLEARKHEFMMIYNYIYKEVVSSMDPYMTIDWMARHLNIKIIRSNQSWTKIDALELDDEMLTFIILKNENY